MADLVLPPYCLACDELGAGRDGLCVRCGERLPRQPSAPCPRCAAPLGPGVAAEDCSACREPHVRFARCVAVGPYAGFPGELVRRAKYGGDPLLLRPLALRLAEAVLASGVDLGLDVVTPVPGVRSRERGRAVHTATVLAATVARAVALPFDPRLLERVGEPVPQASLPRSQRRDAARGTVALATRRRARAASRVAGAGVLLVDDVLTSGGTADACARALLAARARVVHVAVVARA